MSMGDSLFAKARIEAGRMCLFNRLSHGSVSLPGSDWVRGSQGRDEASGRRTLQLQSVA